MLHCEGVRHGCPIELEYQYCGQGSERDCLWYSFCISTRGPEIGCNVHPAEDSDNIWGWNPDVVGQAKSTRIVGVDTAYRRP